MLSHEWALEEGCKGRKSIEKVMCEGEKIIAQIATAPKVTWFIQGQQQDLSSGAQFKLEPRGPACSCRIPSLSPSHLCLWKSKGASLLKWGKIPGLDTARLHVSMSCWFFTSALFIFVSAEVRRQWPVRTPSGSMSTFPVNYFYEHTNWGFI